MANYFKSNRPAVVGVPVDADALGAAFGVPVTRDVEVPVPTDNLEVTTGEDTSAPDSDLHWVEYKIPGTSHVKRVERRVEKGWGQDPKAAKGPKAGT